MYSGLASHTFTSMLHFFIVLSQFKDSSIKELLGRILGPFQEKIHSFYLQGFGNFFKNFSGLREILFVIFFNITRATIIKRLFYEIYTVYISNIHFILPAICVIRITFVSTRTCKVSFMAR